MRKLRFLHSHTYRNNYFATESQKQCFSRRQAMSKTVLFDLVFLTPRQKVSFGPRTQNDDFLGTRPRAAPLGSCQKNSSFFVLGTKLLFSYRLKRSPKISQIFFCTQSKKHFGLKTFREGVAHSKKKASNWCLVRALKSKKIPSRLRL